MPLVELTEHEIRLIDIMISIVTNDGEDRPELLNLGEKLDKVTSD
jgi:hypothetical protein